MTGEYGKVGKLTDSPRGSRDGGGEMAFRSDLFREVILYKLLDGLRGENEEHPEIASSRTHSVAT